MVKDNQKSESKASTEKTVATDVTKEPQAGTKQQGNMIAEAAYYKAEKRDFVPGYELQDWLEAENEIDESVIQH